MLNRKQILIFSGLVLLLGLGSANLEFRDPNPANFYTGIEMNYNNLTGLPNPSMDSEALNLGHANSIYLQRTGDSFEGTLDMNGNSILNLPSPSSGTDPATKDYVDSSLGEATGSQNLSQVLSEGNLANQSIDLDGNKVTGSADPADPGDLVTLGYLESEQAQDLTSTRNGDTVSIGITNGSGTSFTDRDTNASTECTGSNVLFGDGSCGPVSQNYIGDSQSHTAGGQLDMNSNTLTDLPTPSSDTDAATKAYVDNQVSGDACPTGYIKVPGSNKYGTSEFCVMEFEATDDGSGNPVSDATTNPWVSIEWYDAKEACEAQGDNYGLISEPEWMTVAENIMRQEENWADGNIGSTASSGGGLYMGNVNPPSSHSHLGYGYGSADSRDPSNRPDTANHVLSNGETIWDFSGNVRSWTDYYIRGNEQPEPATNSWHEYTKISDFNGVSHARPPNPDWNSDQGIGRIYARDDSATNTRAVHRGGYWGTGLNGGVLYLRTAPPAATSSAIGFRCSYSVS